MSIEPQETAHSDWTATRVTAALTCDLDDAPSDEVRRLVRQLLDGRADVMAEDAVLVADELASNAVRHGTAPRSCRLVHLDHGRRLRVEVDDASPHLPRIRTPDQRGGRGLVLVDRLTSSWGVHRYAHHKTVWAELVLDRPETSASAPHLALTHQGSRLNQLHATRHRAASADASASG